MEDAVVHKAGMQMLPNLAEYAGFGLFFLFLLRIISIWKVSAFETDFSPGPIFFLHFSRLDVVFGKIFFFWSQCVPKFTIIMVFFGRVLLF